MITIIDYGMGNLYSVQKAFEHLGQKTLITSDPTLIKEAEILVLPGVGNFGAAVDNLKKYQLFDLLKEVIPQKPFLGICLGLQLLFENSSEAPNQPGLGLIKGTVKKFELKSHPIPQIGWNKESKFNNYVYFVHSYYVEPEDKNVIFSTTDYEITYCSGIKLENLLAVQYHPEKSGSKGLELLQYFLKEVANVRI